VRSSAGEGAGGPLSGAQGGGRLSTACRQRLPNYGAVRVGECSWSCREGGGRVGRRESGWARQNARGGSSMAAGGAGGTAMRWGGTARSPRRANKGHVELELALLPTPTRKRPAGRCMRASRAAFARAGAWPCGRAARVWTRRTGVVQAEAPRIVGSIATLSMHPYAGRPCSRHVLGTDRARAGDMQSATALACSPAVISFAPL
jgi:hypothetical protein